VIYTKVGIFRYKLFPSRKIRAIVSNDKVRTLERSCYGIPISVIGGTTLQNLLRKFSETQSLWCEEGIKHSIMYVNEQYSTVPDRCHLFLLSSNNRLDLKHFYTYKWPQLGQPGSGDQKSYVLPHMWTSDLGQMQQCGWTWIT
jgi:hypothetical protein